MLQKKGAIHWGMLLSLAANLAAVLRADKRIHALTGIMFGGLTALHIWKHRRSFFQYSRQKGGDHFCMSFQNFLKNIAGPDLQAHNFMRRLKVLHYLPGRIRFFSRDIQHQPILAKEALQKLREIPEIVDCQINVETGSVLVKYRPEAVAKNLLLAEIEAIAKQQTGGTKR